MLQLQKNAAKPMRLQKPRGIAAEVLSIEYERKNLIVKCYLMMVAFLSGPTETILTGTFTKSSMNLM